MKMLNKKKEYVLAVANTLKLTFEENDQRIEFTFSSRIKRFVVYKLIQLFVNEDFFCWTYDK